MPAMTEPQVHRWTRDEYRKMAEQGFFEQRRVELVEGQVIEMAAMKSLHAVAVDLAHATLASLFGPSYYIRQQKPFVIDDWSEPEPDVAVIRGSIRDYTNAHPKQAELLIEVADSSLAYDRTIKTSLYAKAGIVEYWIVNLVDCQLEVDRQPILDPEVESGFCYGDVQFYQPGEWVQPQVLSVGFVAVNDLLP